MTARVRELIAVAQSRGALRLDFAVSLLGSYSEEDDRTRWRVLATGTGRLRTYTGRSLENALEKLVADLPQRVVPAAEPL